MNISKINLSKIYTNNRLTKCESGYKSCLNTAGSDKISFTQSSFGTPFEIFKNSIGGEERYNEIKEHVTDKNGRYVESLGTRFVLALNTAKNSLTKYYKEEYNFMKKVESEGLPLAGVVKIRFSDWKNILQERKKEMESGKMTPREFVMSVNDPDVRAALAGSTAESLEEIIEYNNKEKSFDVIKDVFKISKNKKTEKYDLSDLKHKIIFVHQAQKVFGEEYQEIMDSSYLSDGSFSVPFAEIFIINEVPYSEYINIVSFEKHCLDKDKKTKKEETQFFIDSIHWLSNGTVDKVFDFVTDKKTGKLDKTKANKYTEVLYNCYETYARENQKRINNGLRPIPMDCNKTAELIIETLKKPR